MSGPRPATAEVKRLLADADVVPLVAERPTGRLTPVAAMLALGAGPGSFLLESAEGPEHVARWSIIGVAPSGSLEGAADEDPLTALHDRVLSRRVAPVAGVEAPFTGGAVGFMAYETARRYERLPLARCDPLHLPDAWFGVYDTVVVFDHAQRRLLVVSNVHRDAGDVDETCAAAHRRIQHVEERLDAAPFVDPRAHGDIAIDVRAYDNSASMSRSSFHEAVARCHEYIRAGDIFQVQISRRFAARLAGEPFEVYRALREINPSPYMFYMATPSWTLVGASPEMLVRVTGREVRYHPIAGTRRRGRTSADDERLEQELRTSDKEAAEHLMLVDLGRNDVGRCCEVGSVRVSQLMEVERYSHVMHLVSSIEGRLRPELSAVDALRVCFPAGTVTGAPKIRAMEIIAELEGEARGAYAGAAGYAAYGGNLDTAIALRTVVARDGVAYAQAAAGIVADSTAHEEALEIDNKVSAMLHAIEEVNSR
ncbi:MAG: anthranilate synthase component I family protein [Candidatus Dormibacteria bacterium]